MIRRELKRRLIELEKRYAVAVEAKRDQETAPASWAHFHAVSAAAVVLHGEPKIDEPLRIAYKRMQEKLDKEFAAAAQEWIRECREKGIPNFVVAESFYPELMFSALPGANDNLKFEQIFSNAPVWFLKFTGIEWDAQLLGFKLRDLVGAPELGSKARLDRNKWPALPEETIDAGEPCSETDEPWERIIERRCRQFSPWSYLDDRARLI